MDEQNFERRTINELLLNEQREMKKDLNSRMDRIETEMRETRKDLNSRIERNKISEKFIRSLEIQDKVLTSSIVALVVAVIYSVVK